jgi:Iap family predicted aminopeptidase
MRIAVSLLFALTAAAQQQSLNYAVVKPEILQERLQLAARKNPERYLRLKDLFEEVGCRGESFREQKVSVSKQPNLICDAPGSSESPRKIIVGAHFDAVGTDGVIDNWSGASLLPTLFQVQRAHTLRHTIEFVAFAAEETGLFGSRAYVDALSREQRKQVAAVVVIDSLGLSSTKCSPNSSSPELVSAAINLAEVISSKLDGVNTERVGVTDSAPFLKARIPTITFHSITPDTIHILHSSKDTWNSVSWADYYETHRFLSAYLTYLDSILP